MIGGRSAEFQWSHFGHKNLKFSNAESFNQLKIIKIIDAKYCRDSALEIRCSLI
jgi:hypothetical protein